ncbi:pyruvate formate lyase activating enzyme [Lasallia pustulata]|uniref:Pyruvate formate lyase activating enzyme n=1 Tax=Lasallia pustulata TaxID=136370 RepID=A0A1W5CT37_9LECA|nr:pyruvate formate lyase activating enzyme [Lasallia pustulata]
MQPHLQPRPLRLRRHLHLAPPFLLDDGSYLPRYQLLSSIAAAKKRAQADAHLRNCKLCPRRCGVNRYERTGFCLIGDTVKVSVIAPHFGEEPCIQGHHGSGAVFFSGFCQNYDISHQRSGFDLTPEELGEWYLKLQEVGNVRNINLVTPEHVVPQVALSILHARDLGLTVPIVYNTSAFDSPASLELLDGLVDIYLADMKAWNRDTSKRLLKADDYATAARESIKAMHAQVGDLCFTPDGIAKKGVLLRHLVMPGLVGEGEQIMRWLGQHVSTDLYVNIMEQYRPDAHVGKPKRSSASSERISPLARTAAAEPGEVPEQSPKRYEDINRPVTLDEVSQVRKAAEEAGLWSFCDAAEHGGFNI